MKNLRVAVIAFFTVSALVITAAFSASIKRRPATRSIGPTVTSRRAVRASQARPMQRYASSSFTKTTPPPLGPGPTASAPSAPQPTNIEANPVNLPHGRGNRGAYTYRPTAAPTTTTSSAFLPAPSIEEEFLSRIAGKHSGGRVKVQAAKAGSAKDFDPDRDQETLVLDGDTPAQTPALPPIEAPAVPPAGDDGGGHNRDQGGKPDGQKGNVENK